MGVTTVMCALCRLFELVWLAISHPLFAIVGCGELTYGVLRFIVCMPILGFMMLFDPVYADQAHCLINSHREQVQQFGIDVTNFQAAITGNSFNTHVSWPRGAHHQGSRCFCWCV